ncbi:uncharacterized protein LOC108159442 [Drosophila miranda]|uniref:DUF4806 domain-containing protein n=1 Tax=Drosophila pseudoobscura pseudoobscura TaxID=46245 RepID=A0A6I8V419_DROPS|nr:uncharacterized protein LOC6898336 [Drosophila pseudoobscura]XP_017148219.1 uncharacterized protein LOC108159442 [Drosophila miranda]
MAFATRKKEDPLSSNDDEILQIKIIELQDKLDDILSNQDLIITLLSQVNPLPNINGPLTEPTEIRTEYFPVREQQELEKLDSELANPGNSFIPMMKRILRPEGIIQPLKDSIPKIFGEEIIMGFNFDGVNHKQPFRQFKNINRTIYEIQKRSGYTEADYIADIRITFHTLKRRYHKRKHDVKRRSKLNKFFD